MKIKLMAVLFSAALFSAGSASAAAGNFSYSNVWVSDSNYRTVLDGYEVVGRGLTKSGDMQAEGWEDAWGWVKKIFPWGVRVYSAVEFIIEYGIPAIHYLSEKLHQAEITSNCNWFYDDEDDWNGEMDEEEAWEYEESVIHEDHNKLSDPEWFALRDFCYEHRPRK